MMGHSSFVFKSGMLFLVFYLDIPAVNFAANAFLIPKAQPAPVRNRNLVSDNHIQFRFSERRKGRRLPGPSPQHFVALLEDYSPPGPPASSEYSDKKRKKKTNVGHEVEVAARSTTSDSTKFMPLASTVVEKWKSALDLNNDGKIDHHDLHVITSKLEKYIDVNGDGKVDGEDAKAALSIAMLSTVLLTCPLPACAKGGGGHGGGGHSSSSSSRGSSYTRGSGSGSGTRYSDYDHNDYPSYTRPNRDLASHTDFSLNGCADFPEEGETINVLRDKSTGYYVPGVVTAADNNSKCQFTVYPYDSGIPMTLNSFKNFWILLFYVVPIFGGILGSDFGPMAVFDREFEKLDDPQLGEKVCPPPRSGKYFGTATEKDIESGDDITQTVEARFTFTDSGRITGFGYDSIDGTYTIEGKWKKKAAVSGSSIDQEYIVRWHEYYDDFSVLVQGKMMNEGRITGKFRSSLPVEGTFELDWQARSTRASMKKYFERVKMNKARE